MINVNQITSQLAKMPDPMLQQYAQMHKGDPYILSLALAESNRRKEMRAGAQMGAQQQPKVVDQEIQGMAAPMPEHVGIGQLPAGNMNFADGGIVAFGGGGDVPRYNGSMGSFTAGKPPISIEEISRLYRIDPALAKEAALRAGPVGERLLAQVSQFAQSGTIPLAVLEGGAAASTAAATTMAGASPEQRRGFYSNPMMGAMSPDSALAGAILNAPDEKPAQGSSYWSSVGKALGFIPRALVSDPSLETDRQLAESRRAAAASAAAPVSDAVSRLSPGDKALRQTPVALPTPPAPTGGARGADAAGTGLQAGRGGVGLQFDSSLPGLTQTATGTAQELQNLRGAFPDEIPYAQQQAIDRYRASREQASKAGLEELQADIAKQGPGMVEAEKRAQAKEARLSKQEAEAGPMALIQAGLAIMGGTSPYAAANIGAGGAAGLKAYSDNLDKLEQARDKLDETFGKIESFRQNRQDMNNREIRAAKADIRNTSVEAEKLGLEALTKNTELNRQDARASFEVMSRNRATMFEAASRERLGLAQIQAQKDIAAGRNVMMEKLYGGDVKARAEFGKIQQQVMRELAANPAYSMETNDIKKKALYDAAIQRAMQANPFMAAYAAGVGFSKIPPSGKTYDLMSTE